jgi:uncharacterized repeat protein (TIGR01451 family)
MAVLAVILYASGLPVMAAGIMANPAGADFDSASVPRYNRNVNGDFLMIGNTVMECGSKQKTCANGDINDDLNMVFVDPDGTGPRFNGSSGSLTIPAGSVVDAAYLYWGANLGETSTRRCSGSRSSGTANYADPAKANKVQLKIGTGAYQQVTAATSYTDPPSSNGNSGLAQNPADVDTGGGLVYESVADVSAAFSKIAASTSTQVTVGDIQGVEGNNCHAGWALAVVYKFPARNCVNGTDNNTGSKANLRDDYRNVTIYDGLIRQQENSASTSTTLTGFITPSTAGAKTRLGVLAWEGDQKLTGDTLTITGGSTSTTLAPPVTGGTGSTNNYFDSGKQTSADHDSNLGSEPDSGATITRGYDNNNSGHGIDAKTQSVSLDPGISSIKVSFATDGDNYYPGGFMLSTPISCLLQMEKHQSVNGVSVADDNSTNPNPTVGPGDVITYRVPVVAAGDLALTDVVISDTLPPGTTLVPGSIRVGKGNTAAAATAALASGGSLTGSVVSGDVGALTNVSGSKRTCPTSKSCFAELEFKVTVNSGVIPGAIITNTATGSFTAGDVKGIKEYSNDVTDKVGAQLTVSKSVVNAAAGDPADFSFSLSCTGPTYGPVTFTLKNGESTTKGVPTGATCKVTETTNGNYATVVSGDITSNGGSTVMSANRSVTFTNTRNYGKITVTKTLVGITGDPTANPTPSFTFDVTCPNVSGYPKALSVVGSGSVSTSADIPYGVQCNVSERSNSQYSTPGASQDITVNAADNSVKITNTRKSGSYTVSKATTGGDAKFSFAVDCDGTTFDRTIELTTVNGSASTTVTGLPTGISCKVTENDLTGWTRTAPANSAAITASIPDSGAATFAFSNVRQTSDLVITKAISGTTAWPVTGVFTFTVDCDGTAYDSTKTIDTSVASSVSISGIPVNTKCKITENGTTGWKLDTTVTGNTAARDVTIQAADNNVTFTNTRDTGDITVNKTIDQGSGTFEFVLSCGGKKIDTKTITISTGTTGTAKFTGIPTGSDCTVTETANDDFTQTVPKSGGVRLSSTTAANTASFTNARNTGSLVIAKQFPADSLGDTNVEFEFSWDCGPTPRTVKLKAGATHRVDGILTGTRCTVTEATNADYSSAVNVDGGTVTIAKGDNNITFTNTRKSGTLQLVKSLAPASDAGRFDLLVDAAVRKAAAGNGDKTDVLRVATGSYVVSEAAANGSSLDDYVSSLSCVDTADHDRDVTPVGATVAGAQISVSPGSAIRCTFTNQRRPKIEVVKALSPTDDPGQFSLTLDGNVKATGGHGTATGAMTTSLGQHTVGEAAAGTPLENYTATTACVRRGTKTAVATPVVLAAGDDVVCTITNTRKTGTLKVVKALSPTTDPGTFNLSIDSVVKASAVGNDGTTGAITVNTGNHTVAEAPAEGVTGSDYASALACVDTAAENAAVASTDGVVNVTADAAVVCTFTNTREPADLTITKTAKSTSVEPGGIVSFAIKVENKGKGTARDVTVSDPLPTGVTFLDTSPAGLCGTDGTTCDLGNLAAGSNTTFTIRYKVVAKDAPNKIENSVTVTSPNDPESPGGNAEVPVAKLSVQKTADQSYFNKTGDTLTYTYVVKNIGGAVLHNVAVGDNRISNLDCNGDAAGNGQPFDLAVGADRTCTGSDKVNDADVAAGTVKNVATADSDETTPVTDSATVPLAALTLKKTLTSEGPFVKDSILTYKLTAKNMGKAVLTNVTVADPDASGFDQSTCEPSAPVASLAPGAAIVCQATHKVTQADIDNGKFTNHASADSDETPEAKDEVTTTFTQTPSISFDKLARAREGGGNYKLGDVVTFDLTLTNTGNVTLKNAQIKENTSGVSIESCTPVQPASLAPGAHLDCVAKYTIGQADVDRGSFQNFATGSADGTDPKKDDDTVQIDQVKSIDLAKTVAAEPAPPVGGYRLGDTVTYDLVAHNTGTVTLHKVRLQDLDSGAKIAADCAAASADGVTLNPDAKVSCKATYVITQTDVDAGTYHNVAKVTSSEGPSYNDDETVKTFQDPKLTVVKTVTSSGPYLVGSTLSFSIVVTNVGNVTLHNVVVAESNADAKLGTCTPAQPAKLAPGEKITCTATHVVTQADIDAGSYRNVATGGSDESPPGSGDHTVPLPLPPADLAIVKTTQTAPVPGGQAVYQLAVTNKGPGLAKTITVKDNLPTGLSFVSATGPGWACTNEGSAITCVRGGSLDVGASAASITVTAAVAAAVSGTVANTATVTSPSPDPDTTNNTSTVSNDVPGVQGIQVERAVPTTTVAPPAQVKGISQTKPLAFTGMDAARLVMLGGFMVALGLFLGLVSYRRRRDNNPA